MDLSVSKNTDLKTVLVKAFGLINTDVAEGMVLRAGAAISISNYQRCFFDLTETELDDNQFMTKMFMFVDVFKRAGFTDSVKIAALLTSTDKYRKFLENSATAEGINLKHFTDRQEALSWLCS